MAENKSCAFRTSIGGQALIEGILMRGPEKQAIVVRDQEGHLVEKIEELKLIKDRYPILGWPLVRGVVNLITMLSFGMTTLQESTEMLGVLDEEPTKFEKWLAARLGKGIDKVVMGVAMVLAVILSVGLFILLPTAV